MCGKPETAEDVVQEAFVRVLTNLHKFDERFRFSTWLFTIGRRVYLNQAQKMKPTYDTDVVGSARGGLGEPVADVERDEVQAVSKDALAKALLCLGAEQREAVVLFHQHNWPIAIIAQHMGLPEGTVKSHLHRGRRRLRAALLDGETASPDRLEAIGGPSVVQAQPTANAQDGERRVQHRSRPRGGHP